MATNVEEPDDYPSGGGSGGTGGGGDESGYQYENNSSYFGQPPAPYGKASCKLWSKGFA